MEKKQSEIQQRKQSGISKINQAEILEERQPTVTVKELKNSLKNLPEDEQIKFIGQHLTNPTVQDYQILPIINEIFRKYQPQLNKFFEKASLEELYEIDNRINEYQNNPSLKERVILGTQDKRNKDGDIEQGQQSEFVNNLATLQGNIAKSMQNHLDLDQLAETLNSFVATVNNVYEQDEATQDNLQSFNSNFKIICGNDQPIFSKDILATIDQEQTQTLREMVKFFNNDLKENYEFDNIEQTSSKLSELKDSLDLLKTIKSLPKNLPLEKENIPKQQAVPEKEIAQISEQKIVQIENRRQAAITIDYTSLMEKANITIKRVIDKNYTNQEAIKNILGIDKHVLDQNNITQINGEQWRELITTIEPYAEKDGILRLKLKDFKKSLKEHNLLEEEAPIIKQPSKETIKSWQENTIPEKLGLIEKPAISASINLIEKPAEQLKLLQNLPVKTLKVFAENPNEFTKLCQIKEPDNRIALITALNKCSEESLRKVLPEAVTHFCDIKEPEQQLNIALSLKNCDQQFLTEILSEPLIFDVPALLPAQETPNFFAAIAEYSKDQRQAVLSKAAYDICSFMPKGQRSAILVTLKDTPKATLTSLENHISQIEKIINKTPEFGKLAVINQLLKYEPQILEEVLNPSNNLLQQYEKLPDTEKLDLITKLSKSSYEERQAILASPERISNNPSSPNPSIKTSESTASTDSVSEDEKISKQYQNKMALEKLKNAYDDYTQKYSAWKKTMADHLALIDQIKDLKKQYPFLKMTVNEEIVDYNVRIPNKSATIIHGDISEEYNDWIEKSAKQEKLDIRGINILMRDMGKYSQECAKITATISEKNDKYKEIYGAVRKGVHDTIKSSLDFQDHIKNTPNPYIVETKLDSRKKLLLNSKNARWLYDNQVTTREELSKITDYKKLYNLTSDNTVTLCEISKENFSIISNNTELRKKLNEPGSHKIIHLLNQRDPSGTPYVSLSECTDPKRIDNLMSMDQLSKIINMDPTNARVFFDNSSNKLFTKAIDNSQIVDLLTTKDSEGKPNITLAELANDDKLLSHLNRLLMRNYFDDICNIHPDNLKILLNTRDEKIIDALNNYHIVDLLKAKDPSGKHLVKLQDIVDLKDPGAIYDFREPTTIRAKIYNKKNTELVSPTKNTSKIVRGRGI